MLVRMLVGLFVLVAMAVAMAMSMTMSMTVICGDGQRGFGAGTLYYDIPWRKEALTMFRKRPIQPIMRTSLGSSMSEDTISGGIRSRTTFPRTLH